jgi:dTMP kinase
MTQTMASSSGPSKGKFITLEGGEGAGKTTCMKHLDRRLTDTGISLVVTREPGGTAIGEKIRELLLSRQNADLLPDAELLLMFAARAQHLDELIRPALTRGDWVLCDRFTDATHAYQGGGRGIPGERIRSLEQWTQRGLKPDLTLLLDLPVEAGLERAGQRSTPDRFESESLRFMQQTREAYLKIAADEPERVKVIDAARPLDEVLAQLDVEIDTLLT